MRERARKQEFCKHSDCTRGAEPGEDFCLDHMVSDLVVGADGVRVDSLVKCHDCGKPRHRERPCASCEEARASLEELLKADPDEVFGS